MIDRLVDARRKAVPVFVLLTALSAVGGFAAYQRLAPPPRADAAAEPGGGPVVASVPTLAVTDLLAENGSDADADPYAEDLLREAAPKHLKSVSWSGDFLRVYTDLDESDTKHPDARKLCEAALDYLKSTYSDTFEKDGMVVFVHARRSGNGHVVLVNSVSGPCRSVETR